MNLKRVLKLFSRTFGKMKDKIFQFDQQCYPILELYDYMQFAEAPSVLLNKCLSKLDMLSDLLLLKKVVM